MPDPATTRNPIPFAAAGLPADGTGVLLCELCQAEAAHNFHHLIPRTLHSNKWFKRRYTRQEMQAGLEVCKSCHSAIHNLIPDEKELGRNYHTREKLLAHPQIAKYVLWKQKRSSTC
jgi:hypothetical protein